MSGRVLRRTLDAASGGFQLGGEAPAPAPARRHEPRPRAAVRPVRTFGTRTEAYDNAADVLRSLKDPVRDLMHSARLGQAIDSKAVVPIVNEVAGSIQTHPSALITLARIKAKNERAYMHAIAVCALMINLGRQLELDQGSLRDLGTAGLLHDIGETGLPAGFIDREARFGEEELAIVRAHPQHGHEQLSQVRGLPAVALDVCLNHHERVDGAGYPGRKREMQLSLEAKMASICDVYDAITSYRPYNEAWQPTAGLSEMFGSDGQFDAALLSHFIRSVGIYPVGSLVRLESDHLAIVIDQSETELTKPIVRIFHSILDRSRVPHRDVNLSADNSDSIAGREEPRTWGFLDWDRQWPQLLRAP
jgi:HD-GYP domain-containing protein (c-di-GMP phosphodiesterase class II)